MKVGYLSIVIGWLAIYMVLVCVALGTRGYMEGVSISLLRIPAIVGGYFLILGIPCLLYGKWRIKKIKEVGCGT